MIPPHKVPLQLDNIVFVLRVRSVHHFQQVHLDLCLTQEGSLVFDDFDRHLALLLVIVRLDHLSEAAFADEGVDFVAIEKLLAIFDDVVVVLIVVTVVVQLPLLLVGRVLALGLLSSSFLFGIVNLVDVFVGFDQVDAELSQRCRRGVPEMRWYPGLHRPDVSR